MSKTIMQGDGYSIPFSIKDSQGTIITTSTATDVEITIGNKTKSYSKNEITYSNNKWHYPLTQQETFKLYSDVMRVQIRVKFNSGDVIGKDLGFIALTDSVSKDVL